MSSTEESILHAAVKLFSQRGYSATTTRQIAEEAGVNEVTLFRHFHRKAELFDRIFEVVDRLYPPRILQWKQNELTPQGAIREFCQRSMRMMRESPHLIRLLLFAMLDDVTELRDNLIDARLKDYLDSLTLAFTELKAQGAISEEESPEKLARLLMSQVFGLGMMTLCRYHSFEINDEEELVRLLARRYLGELSDEPPLPAKPG